MSGSSWNFQPDKSPSKRIVRFKTGHLATPRGHHYCRMHSQCNARPMVTVPTAEYHPQMAGTKKRYHGYCVSDLPWVAASKHSGRESNTWPASTITATGPSHCWLWSGFMCANQINSHRHRHREPTWTKSITSFLSWNTSTQSQHFYFQILFTQPVFPEITRGQYGLLQWTPKENFWRLLKKYFYRLYDLPVTQPTATKHKI